MGSKVRKGNRQSVPACACESGRKYVDCCEPLHLASAVVAATPEPTMRSRYCAFVLGLGDYLRSSWVLSNRPPEHWTPDTDITWLGLKIISASVAADGATGTVEFVARSRVAGKGQRHHETSRFELLNGRWMYVDGEIHLTG